MEEEWRDVTNYEAIYMISSLGNIKSLPRIVKSGCYGTTCKGGLVLKKTTTDSGYHRIVLRKNNIKKNYFIHVLVAKAFIKNPQKKPQVNHINGIKSDNRVKNLEWCTNSENILHSFRIGLRLPTKGMLNGMSKLNNDQVFEIRNNYNNLSNKEMSVFYNVNIKTIRNILNKKTWKNI